MGPVGRTLRPGSYAPTPMRLFPAHRESPRCPACHADAVRRSGRQGVLERLLSVVYIYPFRCTRCGQRVRAMQWGARYTTRWH